MLVATIWRAIRSESWSCTTQSSRSGVLARTEASTLETSVTLVGSSKASSRLKPAASHEIFTPSAAVLEKASLL